MVVLHERVRFACYCVAHMEARKIGEPDKMGTSKRGGRVECCAFLYPFRIVSDFFGKIPIKVTTFFFLFDLFVRVGDQMWGGGERRVIVCPGPFRQLDNAV